MARSRCTITVGDDTKAFSISLIVGIRCFSGVVFGLGGQMLHAGWDISKRCLT